MNVARNMKGLVSLSERPVRCARHGECCVTTKVCARNSVTSLVEHTCKQKKYLSNCMALKSNAALSVQSTYYLGLVSWSLYRHI